MSQKKLAIHLKICVVGAFIASLILYFAILPFLAPQLSQGANIHENIVKMWIVFVWTTGIPIWVGFFFCWKIAEAIGQNRSFSITTAKLLKHLSYMAAGETFYFTLGSFILLLMGMKHLSIMILSFFAILIGVFFSVATAGLSHLVYKAADLQEENDLTV